MKGQVAPLSAVVAAFLLVAGSAVVVGNGLDFSQANVQGEKTFNRTAPPWLELAASTENLTVDDGTLELKKNANNGTFTSKTFSTSNLSDIDLERWSSTADLASGTLTLTITGSDFADFSNASTYQTKISSGDDGAEIPDLQTPRYFNFTLRFEK